MFLSFKFHRYNISCLHTRKSRTVRDSPRQLRRHTGPKFNPVWPSNQQQLLLPWTAGEAWWSIPPHQEWRAWFNFSQRQREKGGKKEGEIGDSLIWYIIPHRNNTHIWKHEYLLHTLEDLPNPRSLGIGVRLSFRLLLPSRIRCKLRNLKHINFPNPLPLPFPRLGPTPSTSWPSFHTGLTEKE